MRLQELCEMEVMDEMVVREARSNTTWLRDPQNKCGGLEPCLAMILPLLSTSYTRLITECYRTPDKN